MKRKKLGSQWIALCDSMTDPDMPKAEVGSVVYLVRTRDLNAPQVFPRRRQLYARTTPYRTNQSGEERLQGWLGTTNNVYSEADGAAVVLDHGSTYDHEQRDWIPTVHVRRLHDDDPRLPEDLRA